MPRPARPGAALVLLSLDSVVAGHLAHALRRYAAWSRSVGLALPPELQAIESLATSSALRGQRGSQGDADLRGQHDQNSEVVAVTYTDAAQALSVSLSTVKRMVRRGDLKAVSLGNTKRIPVAELERLTSPDNNDERTTHHDENSIIPDPPEPPDSRQHGDESRACEEAG
ncbi:helix-turn-helix domain-containing protein [Rhodococcus sp. SGAir0479]|uniref:helix-turn-helix domain-containing protein n=1 Tax=Rhodococcus sp. SGAir0479 TaxID=2567884 RepID=UPI0034A0CB53